ncbi:hypothetical protein NDU88_006457 [Pleurodeles waltl]|uniref:Uncharacterized protein n=1 Tax=Pleurodeles waltl TaxID=8319 RepID=A0AAV7X1C4_PLEWA|nr:hypothetical protein NDU88_006457 [Pleurodeles waltl]
MAVRLIALPHSICRRRGARVITVIGSKDEPGYIYPQPINADVERDWGASCNARARGKDIEARETSLCLGHQQPQKSEACPFFILKFPNVCYKSNY